MAPDRPQVVLAAVAFANKRVSAVAVRSPRGQGMARLRRDPDRSEVWICEHTGPTLRRLEGQEFTGLDAFLYAVHQIDRNTPAADAAEPPNWDWGVWTWNPARGGPDTGEWVKHQEGTDWVPWRGSRVQAHDKATEANKGFGPAAAYTARRF